MSAVLSWESFDSAAKQFLAISEKFNDEWRLTPTKDEIVTFYLVKKTTVPVYNQSTGECEEPSLPIPVQLISYEYHIIYSQSYAVPVLYFNAYKQDGMLLKLDEIWKQVPETYAKQLEHQRWSMLTQQEHPFLHSPFYMLHPCNTQKLMEQIYEKNSCEPNHEQMKNYLVTWLSTVGPVVGLTVNPKYALELLNIVK